MHERLTALLVPGTTQVTCRVVAWSDEGPCFAEIVVNVDGRKGRPVAYPTQSRRELAQAIGWFYSLCTYRAIPFSQEYEIRGGADV